MIGVDLIAVCNWMTNYSKNPPVRKLVDRKYPVETIRRKPKKGGKWAKNHKLLITFVKAVFTYLEIECGKCAWRVSMNRISTNRMDRIIIRLKSYLKRSRSGFRLRTYRRIHYANIDATCSWRWHSPHLLKRRVWSQKKEYDQLFNINIYFKIYQYGWRNHSHPEENNAHPQSPNLQSMADIHCPRPKGIKIWSVQSTFGQFTSRLKDDLYG